MNREQWIHLLTHNAGTKVISIVVALVLWIIVLGSRNVEAIKEIPLEIVTAPELTIGNDIPDRLAFRLSGPKAFLRTILDRRDEPIRVNIAREKPGLVTYRFAPDNIQRLPIGVKVLGIEPSSVVVRLERLRQKDVPVRLELHGQPAEGFHVARTELKPPSVRIRGPESRVEGISELPTFPIDVTGVQQTIEKEASVELGRHSVQLISPLPRATIEVEPSSANFRIKNVDIRVLSSYKSKLSDKTVTILVRAGSEALKGVDASRVFAVVDLKGRPKGKYVEKVKVTVPDNVSLVKVIPDKVTVTLE